MTEQAARVPVSWVRACQVLLAVGAATFVAALALGQAQRAWQAYLVNFVLWTGIAQCGVIFSAAYRITNAHWSDAFRRMGESLGFFLPVSLVLFLVLMLFGAGAVYPWVRQPYPGREVWLSVPFVLGRDFAVLAGVFGLSAMYLYFSQGPALAGLREKPKFIERWAAATSDADACERKVRVLAPALVIAFGLGFSLLAFDLIMSLDPVWYNTLFGWYYFVGSFYAAVAVLALGAGLFRRHWNLEAHLGPDQTHDLGRLLFGMCLLTGGLFWAQWLVFWYGNLPEEIEYVIPRYYQMPFGPLGWAAAYGSFVVPLVVLLSKALKRRPRHLMWVALWILAALWLERYLWVVPANWHGRGAPLAIEILITLGFAGGFGWGWIEHNRRLPVAELASLPAARAH